jgi:ribosomal protein S18 acetylase RimI-like enzyme
MRRLSGRDRWEVVGFLRQSPEQNAYLLGQVARGGLHRESVAGVFGGYWEGGELRGVVCVGSNLVLSWPCSLAALEGFAQLTRDAGYAVRVIVGEDALVDAFMHLHGRRQEEILLERAHQVLLRVDHLELDLSAADEGHGDAGGAPWAGDVRCAEVNELEQLIETDLAMVMEELGVDPFNVDPASYRRGWLKRIREGRSWVIGPVAGPIAFKADQSASSDDVVQLSGVYTAPAFRRLGIARRAMATICASLLQEVPVVTLYVHAQNRPALELYRRLGFTACGRVRSVWLR